MGGRAYVATQAATVFLAHKENDSLVYKVYVKNTNLQSTNSL